jgi:hypothetical protein
MNLECSFSNTLLGNEKGIFCFRILKKPEDHQWRYKHFKFFFHRGNFESKLFVFTYLYYFVLKGFCVNDNGLQKAK